jgi:uncharacterized membrane protein
MIEDSRLEAGAALRAAGSLPAAGPPVGRGDAMETDRSAQAAPAVPGSEAAVRLRAIAFDRPWNWLANGWRDMWQAPSVSLTYGIVAAALGLVLAFGLAAVGLESLVPVLAGGFLLIGPLLAAGLYETSRVLAAGGKPTFPGSLAAGFAAAGRLGLLAALLMVFYLIWVRVAVLLVALFLGTNGVPPAREFMGTLLFTPHGLGLLVVGTAVGAVFAAVVFALSVISIPMLMERRVDAFTAMAMSATAVVQNPKPMALWAALIAGFIALGIVTIGAGLVFAFPLIGHATWHAYRDAVAEAD